MMILKLPELKAPLNFTELFGRSAAVEIEIGVGKGRFLRERASAYPDRDFLGIEKSRKWLLYSAVRLEKAKLTNIRLIETYVEGFIERYVPDHSIQAYHIYFPDPWPKRRHHKRRLFNVLFLEQLRRTLIAKGEVIVATDHSEYFSCIKEQLSSFSRNYFTLEETPPVPFQSNYQVKYVREGRPISFVIARRMDAQS